MKLAEVLAVTLVGGVIASLIDRGFGIKFPSIVAHITHVVVLMFVGAAIAGVIWQ